MKNQVSVLYMLAAIFFISCLLIYNIIATKVAMIVSLAIPSGLILLSVTYMVNDIVTEVWGYRKTALMIWAGFAMNLIAVLIYSLSINWTALQFWQDQEFTEILLNSSPRLLFATLLAHPVGSFVNAYILSNLKVKTNGKKFALRAIVSTAFGAGFESLILVLISSVGSASIRKIIILIGIQLFIKLILVLLLLPVITGIVRRIKASEQTDHFDREISYNPLYFNKIL